MTEQRLACITLPDFPLEIYGRLHPAACSRPVALTDEIGETALVTACNSHAAKYDVAVGMTAAQAASHCPGLMIDVRDFDREHTVLRRIHRTIKTIGPDIERDSPAAFFLESSRLTRLYRDESGLAGKILSILQPLGYPVAIGFAVNKFVARLAARHAERHRWLIVPTGAEHAWLRQLRIAQLAMSADTAETLFDLGIATIGRAAALPANEVIQRFGAEGALISRRARGGDPAPFLPERPAEDYGETALLDFAGHGADAILACAGPMIDRLLGRLGRFGLGASEAQIILELDNCTERVFKIAVEKPSLSPVLYLRQLRLELERLRLEAAVRRITIRIPRAAPLILEQTAFERPENAAALRPDTAETISRTLSGNSLCTVTLAPSHLPERRFRLVPMKPSPSSASRELSASRISPTLPAFLPTGLHAPEPIPYSLGCIDGLRLLQPPRPAEIRPEADRPRATPAFLRNESGTHRVTTRQGPWKLSGDWWRAGFDRLYYELRTDDHRRYLVFFDRSASGWFLQGVYD